jgi:integrase/recombinase XerD
MTGRPMTARRRSAPTQKALPLSDWPKADRESWETAQQTTGVLDDGGPASHLGSPTRKDLTQRYAYFLSFLAQEGRLDLGRAAAGSATQENVLNYIRYLEPHVSSVTLAQSLYKIARLAYFLAPERDWRWLKRVVRRLQLRAKPRAKRNDVVEIKELFRLGRKLMDQADQAENATPFSRALLYRDGLITALLATDPLRLANTTALEIGRTLVKDGTTWSVDLPPEETKGRRQYLAVLPDWCTTCIERYVHHYRPLFRNAQSTSRLWLSRNGRPLTEDALYRAVCKRTWDALGKRINPHLFRACLATSTAVHHGAQIGLAMTVLHHQSSKVTERYYNQAKMIDAMQAYQDILLGDQRS